MLPICTWTVLMGQVLTLGVDMMNSLLSFVCYTSSQGRFQGSQGDSMHNVAPPYLPPLPNPPYPPPTPPYPPQPPPLPPPQPPPIPPLPPPYLPPPYLPPLPPAPYLPPLPSARYARQTARFARRGGQPPHPS